MSTQTVNEKISKAQSNVPRMRWRRAIRTVIMKNKLNDGKIGMLKSRARKGQSLNERLARLEESIFNLRCELEAQIKGLGSVISSGDPASGALVNSMSAELKLMQGKLNNFDFGLHDGMLADHTAALAELKNLIEHAGEKKEERPEGSPLLKNLHFIMVDLKLLLLHEGSVKVLKSSASICVVAQAQKSQPSDEPFQILTSCRDLRDRLCEASSSLNHIYEEVLLLARQLSIDLDAALKSYEHDDLVEKQNGSPHLGFNQTDELTCVPFEEGTSDEDKFAQLAHVYLRAQHRWQEAKILVDDLDASILARWGNFGRMHAVLTNDLARALTTGQENKVAFGQLHDHVESMNAQIDNVEKMASGQGQMEAMQKTMKMWVTKTIGEMNEKGRAEAKLKFEKISESITRLFMLKADRDPFVSLLSEKASQNQLEDMTDMMRQLGKF